uniref:cytochrome oxidase subunit III n=1 Tax=Bregmatothrips sinensis TaxID=3045418 RepID=UPI0030DF01A3
MEMKTPTYIPFHLVTPSPWPILMSVNVFNTMIQAAKKMNNMNTNTGLTMITLSLLIMTFCLWSRDIIRESTYESLHTKEVLKGLKMGMILFITSEVLFFLSFFWAFFHVSLSPDISIGQLWPHKGISSFDPTSIPLLNTLILLSSGITLTVSHHFLMTGNKKKSMNYLISTITLGMYFSILQYIEYKQASFSISDSSYGSTFFMSTGFHGLHVLIGSMFLMTTFNRLKNNHFSSYHHFGLEAAAWYWHFVDVVWLFLYICIYWFGK